MDKAEVVESSEEEISKAAKALGRRGGLKGGPARAKSLSVARRREIAVVAAKARWRGNKAPQ